MGKVIPLHRSAPPPFVVIEQPRDYPEEPLYARPDLYRSLDEEARIAAVEADCERDRRYFRLRFAFEVASVVLALVTLGYFVLLGAF